MFYRENLHNSAKLVLSDIVWINSPFQYRSGTVNSNTVNSNFHLIRSYCELFFYHFPDISCLKCTVYLNFHLIRSKTLLTNDFELTVPDLYFHPLVYCKWGSIWNSFTPWYLFGTWTKLSNSNLQIVYICLNIKRLAWEWETLKATGQIIVSRTVHWKW